MSKPLVVVCGPTGAGKSTLAIHLAQQFKGEIINADSVQVYRQFDIGSAKLSPLDRGGIPHHLIDVANGGEGFTAGDFARLAHGFLAEISARGRLPVVAGGTGFYIRALLDGLSPLPTASPPLRARLTARERKKPGSLHRLLLRLDPSSGRRIHPHDLPKIVRALETRILSRSNASAASPRAPLQGFRVLRIALLPPRADLYRLLDLRCQEMLAGGLLDEIQSLLALEIPRDAKPMQSLGYKQGLELLEGRLTPEEALAQMQRDTRRYAKRQMTWFRHEPDTLQLAGFGNDPAVVADAVASVSRLLDLG